MRIRAALLGLVAVALLPACTPVEEPTPSVTTSAPTSTTPDPSPTAEPTSPMPGAIGRPVDPDQYAHEDGGVSFASPSGNIRCGYSTYQEPGWWWCLLGEQSVELPPDPGGQCTGTYVGGSPIVPNGLGMTGGDASATPESFCAGAGEAPVLAYGDSITYREMACDSTEDGMICRSTLNGHGFQLARSDYEIF